MIDKLPELIDLVQQAEDNRLLICGESKKLFVMSGIQMLLGQSEFTKHEGLISNTIEILVQIGHDPNVLNFARQNCWCLSRKQTKKM